jgi:hypothetical protein
VCVCVCVEGGERDGRPRYTCAPATHLRSFLSDDTHANVGLLNHAHVVGAIANA